MPFNIISLVTSIIAWGTIIVWAAILYKKQEQKPRIWKVILVMLVGLFSFSFSFRPGLELAILPLGVWLLYMFFLYRKGRWQVYRKFAWLGFAANYIFLIFALIQSPIHHAIYPPNQLDTYISNVKDATITVIHPSAEPVTLKKDQLQKQVSTASLDKIDAMKWYREMDGPPSELTSERFPYIINSINAKWGSGMDAMIYLEKDGKGLLVTTPQKQLYYHLKNSIIKESH